MLSHCTASNGRIRARIIPEDDVLPPIDNRVTDDTPE